MDEPLNAFLAAQRVFTEVVHAVGDDQWHLPTPDTEWDVAELVGHLVEEHRWAAPLTGDLSQSTDTGYAHLTVERNKVS